MDEWLSHQATYSLSVLCLLPVSYTGGNGRIVQEKRRRTVFVIMERWMNDDREDERTVLFCYAW